MKKILYAAFLLLFSQLANAQTVPNGGFDTWASPRTVETPTGWLTSDDILSFLNGRPLGTFNTGTVTKSTDVHGGTFAVKLTTVTTPPTATNLAIVPGILVLGAKTGIYTLRGLPNAGSAYTTRPTQCNFYYKLSGPATDSASVLVYFTNTVNRAPNLLGYGLQFLRPTTGGYAAISVPIQYDPASTAAPDSVHFQFSSGDANVLTAGTTLLIDDLSLGNTALAVRADASLQEQLTVSPNPSPTGRFSVGSPAQPDLASSPLTVFDMTGRAVLRQPALATPASGRELDLSSLPIGIYTLRLDSKQGALVRQLVVK
jgi:hypothetical protein